MSVLETLNAAWTMRRAWWFTATSRTRARFSRTALGSFWLGISNLLSICVLGFVYGTVFRVPDFNNYFVYLGIGMTVWSFISSSISSAPSLFEYNARNIQNTNTNAIFYPLEEWAFQLQTFAQSFLIIGIALSFFKANLLVNLFSAGLLPLANIILFAFWLPILICLLGARFHDFYQVIPIIMQLTFLLSPILYEKKSLGSLAWITKINPPYIMLDKFRSALISGHFSAYSNLLLLLINLVGFAIAVFMLDKNRKQLPFLL